MNKLIQDLIDYCYSDRNPAEWNITINKNVSRNRTNIDYPFVRAYRVEPAFNKAVQGYAKDTQKNIPNLMKYAKELRIQNGLYGTDTYIPPIAGFLRHCCILVLIWRIRYLKILIGLSIP